MSSASYFAKFFETPKTPEETDSELRSHQKRMDLIATLPLDNTWPHTPLRHYQGFWFLENTLPGVMAIQERFIPDPTDIFLVTYPKSGTTWLKALAFAISDRARGTFSDSPLLHRHPQECSPYLEGVFASGRIPDLSVLPSPRILATHIPYSSLPDSVRASGCRIVYLCRDPKDTLVSRWHFVEGMRPEGTVPVPFAEAFELFCAGGTANGPVWDHQLEYWQLSARQPERVLFLKYEDMMEEPVGSVRRLAEFMGRPFSDAEEREGAAEEIVRLCSFESLSRLEVNKTGLLGTAVDVGWNTKNSSFFRKGKVGDWREHLTPEMADRLDHITQHKLEGSGLSFRQ